MDALYINEAISIPPGDLSWEAARSSGPGGQNVNKVASKVELRFDLPGTAALDAYTKQRLRTLAAGRLDAEGRVLIVSQLTRDQGRNLEDAREKLAALVRTALERPKPRFATKPTRSSQRRRVEDKRRNSERKKNRSFRD